MTWRSIVPIGPTTAPYWPRNAPSPPAGGRAFLPWRPALAIAKLLGSVESPWIARTLGLALILTGGTIYALGFLSYRNALEALVQKGVRSTPLRLIGVITLLLMFSALPRRCS